MHAPPFYPLQGIDFNSITINCRSPTNKLSELKILAGPLNETDLLKIIAIREAFNEGTVVLLYLSEIVLFRTLQLVWISTESTVSGYG